MMAIDSFILDLQKSISLFLPETVLVVTFILALLFDLFFRKSKSIGGIIALLGFAGTGICLFMQQAVQAQTFEKMLAIDPFGQFFKFIILLTSAIIVIFSFFSKELYDGKRKLGEYYTIIIGMTFGMFLMVGATNLVMIYLALETMSISSYILAGYTREIKRSSEASLKYVIFGAISSGIMVYGISIIFGLTGSLNLFEINTFLAHTHVDIAPLFISSIMIVAGFAYKISAVPFHFWTPDVYEGSPITITAFLSVASKAAGFAALIRFLKIGFIDSMPGNNVVWTMVGGINWTMVIAVLAVLTMTLGNLVAVWQTNLKRLLAYSSIAHAGYLLMGVVVLNDAGVAAVMTYFFVYLIMNLGAFFVVMLIANKIGSEEMDDYVGLGYRMPVLGVCMAIFLVSLTGLPPTAGFIGKLMIFAAVIKAGYIWLAVIGVINSVISLYYYVNVFRNLFVRGLDKPNEHIKISPSSMAIALIFAGTTLFFGLFWSPIIAWANSSVGMFLGN